MQNLSDEDLMELIANGEIRAFEILFFRHRSKILGYVYKKLNDRNLAEDILQDIFEKVFKKAHTFKRELKFLPWVFTITRNIMTDHFRKSSKDKKLKDELVSTDHLHASPTEVNMDRLPERYREALSLRYIEGLEFQEISSQMSITTENARKIVSRAVALLKKENTKGKK